MNALEKEDFVENIQELKVRILGSKRDGGMCEAL